MKKQLMYWEDFQIGKVFEYGYYDVSQQEIIEFGLKYDPLPHHTRADLAHETALGVLCASGIHVLGMAQKMLCDNLYLKSALVAGRGVESMKMLQPVVAGDRLRVTLRVCSRALHQRKPDRGWVNLQAFLQREDGHKVMSFENDILFLRQP